MSEPGLLHDLLHRHLRIPQQVGRTLQTQPVHELRKRTSRMLAEGQSYRNNSAFRGVLIRFDRFAEET